MTKQQTWEERFDEEFTVMDEDSGGNLQRVLFLDTGTFMESIDSEIKLKKFIQSELQRQREEIVEIVKETVPIVRKDVPWKVYYNEIRKRLLKKLIKLEVGK